MRTILEPAERLLSEKPKGKNKLYAMHAPEVECIGKGKARQPYEFGMKTSIAITHRSDWSSERVHSPVIQSQLSGIVCHPIQRTGLLTAGGTSTVGCSPVSVVSVMAAAREWSSEAMMQR
jgi:hypothetical protein